MGLFMAQTLRSPVSFLSLCMMILLGFFAGDPFVAGSASTSFAAGAQDEMPVYVHCNLIANCKKVVPGKPFKLGVELNMDPGWHTYYKHSGEAGMPSKIEWQLPEGFKASELMWEKPHKFNDSGIVTFGYSDYTLISAEITPPASFKAGDKLDIKAKVKWLSCKDICVPGSAMVQISLPVAAAGAAVEPANEAKFAKSNFNGPTDGIKEDGGHGSKKSDASGSGGGPGDGTAGGDGTKVASDSNGGTAAGASSSGAAGSAGGDSPASGFNGSGSGSSGPGSGSSENSGTAESSASGSAGTSSGTETATGSGSATGSSTDGSSGSGDANAKSSASGAGSDVLNAEYKIDGADDGKAGLLAYLGFAFIGGFILNFMPCVLPVISIKIFSLIQQAGDNPKKIFQHGMAFMWGILISFLNLGLVVIALQGAGQKIGWGFQFQYPIFVLSMACIVTLFALSMFGVFLVNITAGQQQIDKLASSEGLSGTFFKGVLATVLSTPCTAPFLGTALGFAFARPWYEILTVFFVIGLGMSSPYLVLALRPDWMKYLPKPGTWMERFKESMGFLLLATAVWLLWVLTNQVGVDAGLAAVAFLVCLSFAAWIVGSFLDLTSDSRRRVIVWSVALFTVLAGYAAFLQPFPALLSMSPAVAKVAPARDDGDIKWVPFTLAELDKQQKANKTVFIDFTADWCLTCKANERTVINTAPVIEKLKQLNVVPMKADWTTQDPEITNLLTKFGRSGVPVYVLYPAGKPNNPILLPEVITQSIVLEGLDKAGPSK